MRNIVLILLTFLGKFLFDANLEKKEFTRICCIAEKTTYDFLLDLFLADKTPPDIVLVKGGLCAYMVVLQTQVIFSFVPLFLERVLLALNKSQAIQLFRAILGQALHFDERFVNWSLILRGTYDVLEIFE